MSGIAYALGTMRVSDTDLQEMITIYQDEFGETLSVAEASEMAFRLVNLYTQLAESLPNESCANAAETGARGCLDAAQRGL